MEKKKEGLSVIVERRMCNFRYHNLSMDQIGNLLTPHYRLRPAGEELDFIINYDVKYRMGASAGEEGDE